MKVLHLLIALTFLQSCASDWKIQGGPKSCQKMCKDWDLEFAAMVGVGNQDRSGPGATACVCQPKSKNMSEIKGAGGASSASLAAPITVAAQAAAAAVAQHQAIMNMQSVAK